LLDSSSTTCKGEQSGGQVPAWLREPHSHWRSYSDEQRSAARSNLAVSTFAQMLTPGLELSGSDYSSVTIDAIAGGIFELCVMYGVQDRVGELSELLPGSCLLRAGSVHRRR